MDVLVQWQDGSKNVVVANELRTVKCKHLKVGCVVKMHYVNKWYYGKVLDIDTSTENLDSSDSEDNLPLAKLKHTLTTNESFDSEDDVPLAKVKQISKTISVSDVSGAVGKSVNNVPFSTSANLENENYNESGNYRYQQITIRF